PPRVPRERRRLRGGARSRCPGGLRPPASARSIPRARRGAPRRARPARPPSPPARRGRGRTGAGDRGLPRSGPGDPEAQARRRARSRADRPSRRVRCTSRLRPGARSVARRAAARSRRPSGRRRLRRRSAGGRSSRGARTQPRMHPTAPGATTHATLTGTPRRRSRTHSSRRSCGPPAVAPQERERVSAPAHSRPLWRRTRSSSGRRPAPNAHLFPQLPRLLAVARMDAFPAEAVGRDLGEDPAQRPAVLLAPVLHDLVARSARDERPDRPLNGTVPGDVPRARTWLVDADGRSVLALGHARPTAACALGDDPDVLHRAALERPEEDPLAVPGRSRFAGLDVSRPLDVPLTTNWP